MDLSKLSGLSILRPHTGSKKMASILVVDDESHIRDVVCFALSKAGYETIEATDGHEAIRAFSDKRPDLIVLDIVMPGPDGTDVCREIRKSSDVPILFLSSRDEEIDRIIGFEIGGDDYVTKPFSPRELVARVKAVLRRGKVATTDGEGGTENTDSEFRFGAIQMNVLQHYVSVDDEPIQLTATEFAMLRTLIKHPDQVFSRSNLMQHSYELQRIVSDRTIDSHIRRLRKKLLTAGVDAIETVHGVGFRLRKETD